MFRYLVLFMLVPRIEPLNLAPPYPPSYHILGVQVSLENNELWNTPIEIKFNGLKPNNMCIVLMF